MLKATPRVYKGIAGIDPNQSAAYARQREENWVAHRRKIPLFAVTTAHKKARKRNGQHFGGNNTPRGSNGKMPRMKQGLCGPEAIQGVLLAVSQTAQNKASNHL
jgi:hypothetical protein